MAVGITTRRYVALIVSAYDVRFVASQAVSEEQLRGKLQVIRDAYDRVKCSEKGQHSGSISVVGQLAQCTTT